MLMNNCMPGSYGNYISYWIPAGVAARFLQAQQSGELAEVLYLPPSGRGLEVRFEVGGWVGGHREIGRWLGRGLGRGHREVGGWVGGWVGRCRAHD